MFREFYQRHKPLVLAAMALLLVNLVVLVIFTLPKMDAEAFNRNRVRNVQQQHGELQRILNERRQFEQFLQSNSGTLRKFYTDILGRRPARITDILAEREEISNQFGIVPTQVRYAFQQQEDIPLERFRMSFPLSGTYESFRFFVNTMENSQNFFIIDDIELANQQEETETMNMRIAVTTYFHSPPEERRTEEDADE